jgi:large subunit ribosomal protein L15
MAHKNRKVHSKRGQRTSGWGGAQKHRGAGSRGGRGNAGTGKHKQIKMLIEGKRFGKVGFKRHASLKKNHITINVGVIDRNIEAWAADGTAKNNSGVYVLDVTALGYDKVLGSGKLTHKIEITSETFSKSAIEKIEGAGGSALATNDVDTV